METKTIPFDLETAKKIQAGEIEGKIKTRCGYDARILCDDLMGQAQPVLAAFITCKSESVSHYTTRGRFYINGELNDLDLVLEVPDNEPQFKPFDRVLVRGTNNSLWVPRLFDRYQQSKKIYWCQDGSYYEFCIPYEGNQHLVGTTDKPKED
jgi:hypothetical protein